MKKLLPLPIALFPYAVCAMAALLALVFFDVDIFVQLFTNNLYVPLIFLLICWGIALVCALKLSAQCTYGVRSTESLVRLNWALKMVQFPAHCILFILLFALGVSKIWVLMLPIAFGLQVLSWLSVVLTGVIGLGCVKNCWYECKIPTFVLVLIGIGQFVFIFDMIGALILFVKVGTVPPTEE